MSGPAIPEPELRTLVRQRLEHGVLPVRRVAHLDAGYGHAQECAACGHAILPTQIEYDVLLEPQHRLRFHLKCFSLWQLECAERMLPAPQR